MTIETEEEIDQLIEQTGDPSRRLPVSATTDEVASPTFVLVRHYRGRLPVVHADLYRLDSDAEVADLGLLELSQDGVLVVEWADRAPWLEAPDRLRLRMGPATDPDSRTPRRFASTITARHASDRPTRCELSEGANDVIAKIPAEIDTATVRT